MKKTFCFITLIIMCLTSMLCACGSDNQGNTKTPFDYSALPYYDAEATAKSYSYTDEQMARPYWLGNTMYNENAMCIKNDDGESYITTLYKPLKVISVRDWTLTVEYKEGTDYEVLEDGRIKRLQNSSIPVFEDGWAYGKNMPEKYIKVNDANVTGNNYRLFDANDEDGNPTGVVYSEGPLYYGNNVNVSYVYDPACVDYTKVKSYSNELTGLTQKLQDKDDIKMLVFGDSISEGCSASGHWGRDPFCPFYGEIVKNELERIYDVEIDFYNYSLGGASSRWGCGIDTSSNGGYNATKIKNLAPDLIIIGFGMNDVGGTPSTEFYANIQSIADNAREGNPNCQIVFLNAYPGQKYFVSRTMQEALRVQLQELSYMYDDATFIDMFTLGLDLLKTKQYYEITNNGVNHPNDFMQRVYAMNILCSIVDYNNLNA